MYPVKTTKKLIEVALPLDKINEAAAREKSIRHGHPSTLHLWWARRPLAAARAVIFAQMVNDPSETVLGDKRRRETKEAILRERERLFGIIERLVVWENTNNEAILNEAREEIRKSWRHTCELNKNHPDAKRLFDPEMLPGFHDPFAGGGALPLEALRLGLEVYASDLNPIAVLINKGMIEIPYRFLGVKPFGPGVIKKNKTSDMYEDWSGIRGLSEDIRRYGNWLLKEVENDVSSLYPKVLITEDLAHGRDDLKSLIGQELNVIAWLWSRTVKSPNPAFSDCEVPLVASFSLTSKKDKTVWVETRINSRDFSFGIRTDGKPEAKGTVSRKGATCIFSGSPIDFKYIRSESKSGRIGQRLMAIVAEGKNGRVFLSPDKSHETIARSVPCPDIPKLEITHWPGCTNVVVYGLDKFSDLFTNRQKHTLEILSKSVAKTIEKIRSDAVSSGQIDDNVALQAGGAGIRAYAEAIGIYLAMAVSKTTNRSNAVVPWMPSVECPGHLFSRHAIPMNWDFAEANIITGPSGSFSSMLENTVIGLEKSFIYRVALGRATQSDARNVEYTPNVVVSTDPPYYDNIPYSELSDFFYVWLRPMLKEIYPSIFSTMAVPKQQELVANVQRYGSKPAAENEFEKGMREVLENIIKSAHPCFPITIYYAFKQSETEIQGTVSTGWERFLGALIDAGFQLSGTWPMRTEREARTRGIESNALASSIVLVCRKRPADSPTVSRREFIRELNANLPDALDEMTRGGVNSPVAPVDLSQAIIGPGMGIFSQYAAVLEADGTSMSVKTALQLINRFFAEDDFDHDTQFCLHWFEDQGWATGQFGSADVLARAKGTSPAGLKDSGVAESGSGNFRLLRWAEYPNDWSPENDSRTPVWEALHHMIRALNQDGESAAGTLLARMPASSEPIRALAYRLYTLCERKGWAEEARAYNELVTAWGPIEQSSNEVGHKGTQTQFDF